MHLPDILCAKHSTWVWITQRFVNVFEKPRDFSSTAQTNHQREQ